jgi:hypothetical protein
MWVYYSGKQETSKPCVRCLTSAIRLGTRKTHDLGRWSVYLFRLFIPYGGFGSACAGNGGNLERGTNIEIASLSMNKRLPSTLQRKEMPVILAECLIARAVVRTTLYIPGNLVPFSRSIRSSFQFSSCSPKSRHGGPSPKLSGG